MARILVIEDEQGLQKVLGYNLRQVGHEVLVAMSGAEGLRLARELLPDLVLLDLLSPGPILRWGGHSQGTDALSAVIGAFFGRLIIPIDFAPGIEARVDAVSPEVLYAAFLMDIADRCAAAGNSLSSAADLDAWTRAECRRIQRNDTAWAAAGQLLVDVGLRTPILTR